MQDVYSRYDIIIHLVTAAFDAEEYYTCENNNIRNETAEMARDIDKQLQKSWIGHSRFYLIDNAYKNFIDKISSSIDRILE